MSIPPAQTDRPRALGFRWPAEWEPHEATWIAWPHCRETWPHRFHAIPPTFARLVELIRGSETVRIVAEGRALEDADDRVGGFAGVELYPIPTNDAWIRDYGPTFVTAGGGRSAAIDWRYNAWGGKYPPWEEDNAVAGRIAAKRKLTRFAPGLVLEGGAIDGNGQGLLMTTASCLLSPARNPTMDRTIVERFLREYLSADRVLWLPESKLPGDDTDGHIDQLARFVGPSLVLAACGSEGDEPTAPLARNLAYLQRAVNEHGRSLEVVPLPLPPPVVSEGVRLPASYCNFYVMNSAVIVPTFGHTHADARACSVLREVFPKRDILPFPARDLVLGLGAIHCLTLQQPAIWSGNLRWSGEPDA